MSKSRSFQVKTANGPQKTDDLQSELESIPGDNWVEKLKFVFEEVDSNHSGTITQDEWQKSRLRFLISDRPLNDDQMREIFNLIDYNCDNSIEWNELVDFLLTHDSGIDTQNVEKKLKITYVAPNEQIMNKSHRAAANFKIMYLQAQGEIVTLTENTMTFWSPDDCDVIRTFSDDINPFCDFCELKCLAKIVIAKANRQIIFYDIRTHKKIDFVISATLETTEIPKMTYLDSKSSIVGHGLRNIPLFNTPTAIVPHLDQPIIIIGDDDGNVEVYKLITSGIAKIDWASQRILTNKIHNAGITQILYLADNEAYASSSLDGTFVIWRFAQPENILIKSYKIAIRDSPCLHSFVYDARTRDIVFTTNSHHFGVWRTFTTHQELIETRSEIIQTLAIVPFSEDASFCVAISKKNSISLYRMPNMEIIDSKYLGLQHELCPPASALYMRDNIYFGGAFVSRWNCRNSTNEGLSAHKSPIVTAMTNDVFGRIISIDQSGEMNYWDIQTGRKICSVSLNEVDAMVLCAQQDSIGRRIAVGFSNGLVKFVSANSGTLLSTIEKDVILGSCNYVLFAPIYSSNRFLCCSSSKIAVLFEDLSGNRIRFVRKFVGHSEPVTRCAVLKEKYVITIGSERELFMWNIQMQNPIIRFSMPFDPTVALDLPDLPDTFLVGDVYGNIHIMRTDQPQPLSTFKGVGMTIKSPLTSLLTGKKTSLQNVLISGNLHGYVKYWTIEKGRFIERGRFRAHNEAILSISLSEETNTITTASRDEEIRIWSLEPFGLIGPLGKAFKFLISDEKTWESKSPLPDEPMHFMDPLEAEMALAKEKEKQNAISAANAAAAAAERRLREEEEEEEEEYYINEEKIQSRNGNDGNLRVVEKKCKKRKKRKLAPFSIEAIEKMYEMTETQCLTGRKYLKTATMREDDLPKSARPKPPPDLEIDLVDNNLITKTITLVDQALSKPKIWKPPKGKM